MNKVFLACLAAFLLVAVVILAMQQRQQQGSDPKCISDCQTRGYGASYCQSRCSLDPLSQDPNASTADPSCMHNCSNVHSDQAYCTKSCTY